MSLKWRVPYYKLNSLLCFVNVVKGKKVELNFSKAYLFQEELEEILDFKGRTVIGGLCYTGIEDDLEILLQEANRIAQKGVINR